MSGFRRSPSWRWILDITDEAMRIIWKDKEYCIKKLFRSFNLITILLRLFKEYFCDIGLIKKYFLKLIEIILSKILRMQNKE